MKLDIKRSKKEQPKIKSSVPTIENNNKKAIVGGQTKTPKSKFGKKVSEKLDMYDVIISNLIAGTSIIEPTEDLDRSHIEIGFSNIASEKYIIKYFLITHLPDWLDGKLLDNIRYECVLPGIRVNFMIHGNPHRINWESSEMVNRMRIWKTYANNNNSDSNAFDYREKRQDVLAKDRIINSTMYLNVSELEFKRTLIKTSIVIEIACKREDEALLNMSTSIKNLKRMCKYQDIKIMELRINMIDWIQQLGMLSLRNIKEVTRRVSKKILTDDILAANFNSYKQGRIGTTGTPFGMDVQSMVPVFKKLKENPDDAENILIAGGTGSGKSMFIKILLTWLLADFVITVLDYEGDEYTNLSRLVYSGNHADSINISMGKGSTVYFDPLEIGDLTGVPEIDNELKETAVNYILATLRLIVAGVDGELNKWQAGVITTAIKRVYDNAGVTDDNKTWDRSKGHRISEVYEEICDIVTRHEFADDNMDNIKHMAAVDIVESCRPYFEEGEAKSGTFKNPINIEDLRNGKLIVFSFGLKGADNSQVDSVALALKQLSVSNISSQISNHCKYVRHCFNVKVWEEYQRWGLAKGSAEIIGNAMTGGRKRGDINFIITNDLDNMLKEDNPLNGKLVQNITGYIIGSIQGANIRKKFCERLNLPEMIEPLGRIYKASCKKVGKRSSVTSKFRHSFCMIMVNTGEKAIIKAMVPEALLSSNLFRTGVDIDGKEK